MKSPKVKQYKLLRHGHAYLHVDGDLAIYLSSGNRKKGYTFLASTPHPAVFLQRIHLRSRVIPNDGKWVEFNVSYFKAVTKFHGVGMTVTPPDTLEGRPVVDYYRR
jgi:hypothetical protein